MKTKIINCGTYPFDIMVSFSKEELIKKLRKFVSPSELEELIPIIGGKARTILLEGHQIVLYMDGIPNTMLGLSFLHHEIFHCVSYLMQCVGIPHSEETEEAWAYQVQYLTQEIYRQFNFSFSFS